MGVFSSFLLFWIGMNVFLLDSATLQTFIFLKLAVAGHMTIYLARTGDNHFWVRPLPGRALFFTAEATQLAGTFFAAYGILMKPIGWALAGFIWGFAMVFFVVNNFVKVYFYRATERSGIFTSKFRKAG
jgi:H+-transporting ATPase